MNAHKCKNVGEWRTCSVCEGRLHDEDCTTTKNKNKDCCWKRHKMLFDQGFTVGLFDSSQPMLGGTNQ